MAYIDIKNKPNDSYVRHGSFSSAKIGNLTVNGVLTVGGTIFNANEPKNRIEELENKINSLEYILNKQQKIIEALWYNPGPGGPGAIEASDNFTQHSEALNGPLMNLMVKAENL